MYNSLTHKLFRKEVKNLATLKILTEEYDNELLRKKSKPVTEITPKIITLIDDIAVGTKQTSLGFTSYHLDAGDKPLYPFGYGLSYTTFDYSPVTLSATEMSADGSLVASCTIKNTGSYDAEEAVQLYIGDKVASVVRPVKELKGFDKVLVKAGESVTVEFTVTADMLAFTHLDGTKGAEAGDFDLWIAADSDSGTPVTFTLK